MMRCCHNCKFSDAPIHADPCAPCISYAFNTGVSHSRWADEFDYVPVPMGEVDWSYLGILTYLFAEGLILALGMKP